MFHGCLPYDSSVWKVDRYTFKRIARDLGKSKLASYVQFLSSVKLLAPLTNKERAKIAEALEEQRFDKGAEVFRQGDQGNAMYIVLRGEVAVTKDGKQVANCKVGEYFGELALLNKEGRQATVTAVKKTQCLRLDAAAFALLMGPLETIMKERGEQYEEVGPARQRERRPRPARESANVRSTSSQHAMILHSSGSFSLK
jgi:cAMP-dependent protein kinase regulator